MNDAHDEQPESGARAPDVWAQAGVAQQDYPPGLYVVATPLGNAADMSLRALWVLRLADCIAVEDTRTSAPLLARFGIRGRLVPLHRHNEAQAGQALLARLVQGERVALVSDAGTPAISDPGALLVRSALDAGVRVMPIPGASSMAAALCVAGILTSDIRFAGFAPAGAQARSKHWAAIAAAPGATVVFEAPHRIAATLQELAAALDPQRRVVVARELTKKFETVIATRAGALVQSLGGTPARGEYVIVVDAHVAPDADAAVAVDERTIAWLHALAAELPPARAAAVAARVSGLPRDVLYRMLRSAPDD